MAKRSLCPALQRSQFAVDRAGGEPKHRPMQTFPEQAPVWIAFLVPIIILLAIWEGVWKCIAMWKSARNKQLAWFVCIAIFNTIGILPILYLLLGQRDRSRE